MKDLNLDYHTKEKEWLRQLAIDAGITDEKDMPYDFKRTVLYLANDRNPFAYVFLFHHHVSGMSYKEIGEIYSLHPTTIRKHVIHADKVLHHPDMKPVLQKGIHAFLPEVPWNP